MLNAVLLVLPLLVSGLSVRTRQYLMTFEDIHPSNLTYPLGLRSGVQWENLYVFHPASKSDREARLRLASASTCAVGPLDDGVAGISAVYSGSSVVFFDLSRFHWACLLSGSSHPRLQPPTPVDCVLTMRAWEKTRQGREPSVTAQHYFLVNTSTESGDVQMSSVNSAVHFRACERVEFEIKSISGADVKLVLDDVRYKTYNVTSWGRTSIGEIVHENGPYGIA